MLVILDLSWRLATKRKDLNYPWRSRMHPPHCKINTCGEPVLFKEAGNVYFPVKTTTTIKLYWVNLPILGHNKDKKMEDQISNDSYCSWIMHGAQIIWHFLFIPYHIFARYRERSIWVFESETLSWNPGPLSF